MKSGAIKSEETHSPEAPGGLSAMSRRTRFAVLFIIVGGVLGIWSAGPRRA